MGEVAVNTRDIQRNVRGQIVSYPAPSNTLYGKVYFIDQADGTQTKPSRYAIADLINNFDIEIKELSFPQLSIQPNQVVRQRARQGAIITLPNAATGNPGNIFFQIPPANGIPWPPFNVLEDGTRVPNGYGFPPNVYPAFGDPNISNPAIGGPSGGAPGGGPSGPSGPSGTQPGSGYGGTNTGTSSGTGFFGGLAGYTTSTITGCGRKIICNELYRQGYLSEELWNADERYGDMMFESDPKLAIGYQMWARKVVKYMRKNPNNTKFAYWLFKPWTEYMGYKMGVIKKPTLMGRFTNWIGSKFSYMVFDLYGGQKLLDKYNQRLAV